MPSPDELLMQQISQRWAAMIAKVTDGTDIPAAFLGALIAGESGGNPRATRFEPGAYDRLKNERPGMDDDWCRANATSWGLTQIMGLNYPGPPKELADPGINLTFAVKMLTEFSKQYLLDLSRDFEYLFRCWNTGSPHGRTYDPEYPYRGMARMGLWPKGAT